MRRVHHDAALRWPVGRVKVASPFRNSTFALAALIVAGCTAGGEVSGKDAGMINRGMGGTSAGSGAGGAVGSGGAPGSGGGAGDAGAGGRTGPGVGGRGAGGTAGTG